MWQMSRQVAGASAAMIRTAETTDRLRCHSHQRYCRSTGIDPARSCTVSLFTGPFSGCTSIIVLMRSAEEDDLDEDDRLLLAAMEQYEAQEAARSPNVTTAALGCTS